MATLTTNKNFLSPVGFQLKINSNEYANLEYFCVGINLPGLSIASVDIPYKGANAGFTGDRIIFDDLSIRCNITEDMENYIETFQWIHNIAQNNNPESFKEDATLLILNSHNNVTKEIKFNGIYPINMAAVEFDSQAESVEFVQMDITFGYTNFEIT